MNTTEKDREEALDVWKQILYEEDETQAIEVIAAAFDRIRAEAAEEAARKERERIAALKRYTFDQKGLPMFDENGEYIRLDDPILTTESAGPLACVSKSVQRREAIQRESAGEKDDCMDARELYKSALISIDMAMINIRGGTAALKQTKTFPADVRYSVDAIEGAIKFLQTALQDLGCCECDECKQNGLQEAKIDKR